ncbi:hypothetical protein MUK42_03444 [Musa troglodytarum]|uniref:Uncharacterized protein n=2 Tax=Musa troglodytarum TaxID=320322 RepID=A0A9E7KUG6_9LILI|nr:hypothetical protein MUK42_03444 [Musa troglodytarum]
MQARKPSVAKLGHLPFLKIWIPQKNQRPQISRHLSTGSYKISLASLPFLLRPAKEERERARAASVRTLAPPTRPFAMEMRKIACAVLVAAATATTALAAEAPAPGPASAASFAAAPAVGAAVLSFFAFYLQ